jgi:hypothetical protein
MALSIAGLIVRVHRALDNDAPWLGVAIALAALTVYGILEQRRALFRFKFITQVVAAAVLLQTVDAPFAASYATDHRYEMMNTALQFAARLGVQGLELPRLAAQGPAGERLLDDSARGDRSIPKPICIQYAADVAEVHPENNPVWRSALARIDHWCRYGSPAVQKRAASPRAIAGRGSPF